MVFADDLTIAGVLDWEAAMVCVASPELDLGWWLFSSRFAIEAVGLEAPEGFPSRDETIARYEELTGHRPRHLEFYEIFAAVRASALMVRAAHLMSEAGFLPPDNAMALNNPATQTLAAKLGQPDLYGDAITFAGNRGGKSSLTSVASRDAGGSR
jgi:aminoglycoside phosphotransferase (APT) family kinase protein